MTRTTGKELDEMDTVLLQPASKTDKVRSVFENVPRYLNSRNVDIQFRVETIREFASRVSWRRLLDIGCGNGIISLPLASHNRHVTLVDLSTNMVAIARSNVPESLAGNVEIRNENFMTAQFEPASFDLIVSVGVLAHVDSPSEFIAKISAVLCPGGSLIVEFTDSRHPTGRLQRFLGNLKEQIVPAKYATNVISFSGMAHVFRNQGMIVRAVFRYAAIPIPGINRVLGHDLAYRITRFIFGRCTNNRNSWLGNEYICLVTKD